MIKEYFALDDVLHHMFNNFQKLLGMRFVRGLKSAWCDDVWEWLVYDKQKNKIIGKFYLDLFYRSNKFPHMACFSLKHSTFYDQYAVAAVVCNFTKEDNMLLLTHSDVESLYHEFGHVMHNMCGTTKYLDFSGTQTERDFVEMPSQMLENWCWEFDTIKKLSKHYKTGESMPDDMIHNLINTRHIDSGISNCKQLVYAMIDQVLHTETFSSPEEIIDKYYELHEEILGIPCQNDTFALANFGHIVGGYDAQYYGYLWSKVYADDIYRELISNSNNDTKYKKEILEFGGSKDAIDMIYSFLGRKPSNEAFLRNLGILAE
jgi:Zn-dependent oligopeptidase